MCSVSVGAGVEERVCEKKEESQSSSAIDGPRSVMFAAEGNVDGVKGE